MSVHGASHRAACRRTAADAALSHPDSTLLRLPSIVFAHVIVSKRTRGCLASCGVLVRFIIDWGWARLTSIMTRVAYLAVTLLPRVEQPHSWPPLQSPMRCPACLQKSPISTRTEPSYLHESPLLLFDLCVRLKSFTKPVYKRTGNRHQR